MRKALAAVTLVMLAAGCSAPVDVETPCRALITSADTFNAKQATLREYTTDGMDAVANGDPDAINASTQAIEAFTPELVAAQADYLRDRDACEAALNKG